MPRDYLLYDGECPVCRSYVAMARLRRLFPHLRVAQPRAIGVAAAAAARTDCVTE